MCPRWIGHAGLLHMLHRITLIQLNTWDPGIIHNCSHHLAPLPTRPAHRINFEEDSKSGCMPHSLIPQMGVRCSGGIHVPPMTKCFNCSRGRCTYPSQTFVCVCSMCFILWYVNVALSVRMYFLRQCHRWISVQEICTDAKAILNQTNELNELNQWIAQCD